MKKVVSFAAAVFLLFTLSACSQDSVPKEANKTEKATEAPKTTSSESTNKQTNDKDGANVNTASPAAKSNPKVTNKNTSEKNQVPVTLSETVDGDTIKVIYNGHQETVRYLLIDTPEEKKPGVCVQPYAYAAANRNKQLLNSGRITLEFESSKSRTDKYGRLLAYVFVNGASVQEALLKEGYARVAYIYEPPYKYLNQYSSDEKIAKSKRLNIWSRAGYVTETGFRGCAGSGSASGSTGSTSKKNTTDSNTINKDGTQYFANCTELRKKYPDGVPKGHPAYRSALDRDKDGYACES